MNLPKQHIFAAGAVLSLFALQASAAQQPADEAAEAVRLPVLTVMADRELRNETAVEPVQEGPAKRKALQRQVMKLERDVQNSEPDAHIVANMDYQPPEPAPDMSSLNPAMQRHLLNIAEGLKSSDPRNGIYTMLQPLGLDRSATTVQMSREQINLGVLERGAQP